MYSRFKKIVSCVLIIYMAISCVNVKSVMSLTSIGQITLAIANATIDNDEISVAMDYIKLQAENPINENSVKSVKAYLGNSEYDLEYYWHTDNDEIFERYWTTDIPIEDLPEGKYKVTVIFEDKDGKISTNSIEFKRVSTVKLKVNSPEACDLFYGENAYFNISVDKNINKDLYVSLYVNDKCYAKEKNKIDGNYNIRWHKGINKIQVNLLYGDTVIDSKEMKAFYDDTKDCKTIMQVDGQIKDYNKNFIAYANDSKLIVENLNNKSKKVYDRKVGNNENVYLVDDGSILIETLRGNSGQYKKLQKLSDGKVVFDIKEDTIEKVGDKIYTISLEGTLSSISLKNGEMTENILQKVMFINSDDKDTIFVRRADKLYKVKNGVSTLLKTGVGKVEKVVESGNIIYYADKVSTYIYVIYKLENNKTTEIDKLNLEYGPKVQLMVSGNNLFYEKQVFSDYSDFPSYIELYKYDGKERKKIASNIRCSSCIDKIENGVIRIAYYDKYSYFSEDGMSLKGEEVSPWYESYSKKTIGDTIYGYSYGLLYEINTNNERNRKVMGIELNQKNLKLKVGEKATLKANILPTNALNKTVTWTSENTDIAKVNSNGEIEAVGAGSTSIVVKSVDGEFQDTCNLVVTSSTIELSEKVYQMEIGQNKSVEAIINPTPKDDIQLIWTTSDSSIASVKLQTSNYNKCVIVAKKAGIVTLTAKTIDGSLIAQCKVVVNRDSDVNKDKVVDALDLAVIAQNYNRCSTDSGWNDSFDINCDNIIDIYDLVRIATKIEN